MLLPHLKSIFLNMTISAIFAKLRFIFTCMDSLVDLVLYKGEQLEES
jgi:hypothetical protein